MTDTTVSHDADTDEPEHDRFRDYVVTPHVTLVATTGLTLTEVAEDPRDNASVTALEGWLATNGANDADELAEFAGRACYQSFSRPSAKTRANRDYLAHILEVEHESVLEHATATFYLTGVSRSFTHELLRHRHLSFSQQSQRYVDEMQCGYVVPPDLRDVLLDHDGEIEDLLGQVAYVTSGVYDALVHHLEDCLHLPRKRARQAARAVLPNRSETRIVVTGTLRAWRDMLKQRYHVAADEEIREIATELLAQLRLVAPNTFQDFPDQPFGTEEDQ
jgi:thymidylate synthase (FAD)